jgi:hypothetical protein
MKDNPEKSMILLFPLITLGVFLAGVLGAWALGTYMPGLFLQH